MKYPTISILIPCRNEVNYIENCLNSVLQNDYPPNNMEVLVIDGDSDDGTVEKIRSFEQKYSIIKLYNNQNKTVPFALNIGIKESKGSFIIRIDAHSTYPTNYFTKLIEWQLKTNADNIGGRWNTLPGNDTTIAQAIALASSSVFGVGNANYRLKTKIVQEVDTVPFGCYKKEVFDKIGLFDEELTRNQDDEFNARLINNGGKIFLVPEIEINYFARKNLRLLSKMNYQYGLFKPLVNRKLGKPATLRQFAPPLFVLGIILLPIFCLISSISCIIALSFILTYFMLNLISSVHLSLKAKKLKLLLFFPIVFLSIHFSYGIGFIIGLLKFNIFRQKVNHINTNISR